MGHQWSEAAIRYLSDPAICPRCDAPLNGGYCPRCLLDLRSDAGAAVWRASQAAAEAIRERERAIAAAAVIPAAASAAAAPGYSMSVPVSAPGPGVGHDRGPGRAPALAPQRRPEMASAPSGSARAEWSVQALLAIAGAGLVGIAAIVFAFVNPELDDPGVRLAIIGGVTVLFATGALLSARRLRLTAESLAALSAVFLGLDVRLVSELVPEGGARWLVGGIGLLLAGALLLVLGAITRLRGWLFPAALALASFAPVLARAADDPAVTRLGLVAVGAVALVVHLVLDRVGARDGARLTPERVALTVGQLAALALLAGTVVVLRDEDWGGALLVAGQLALAGALALAAARWTMPAAWSVIGAVALVIAALYAGAASAELREHAWVLVAMTAVVAAVLVLLALATRLGAWRLAAFDGVRAAALHRGAAVAALTVVAPLAGWALGNTLAVAVAAETPRGEFERELPLALAASLAAIAAGLLLARAVHRPSGSRLLSGTAAVAPWLLVVAVPAAALWPGFGRPEKAAITIAAAAALAAVVALPRVRAGLGLPGRIPAAVLAHILLGAALVVGARDPAITELVGIAVIAALVLVARLVPAPARALHWGAGDALALGVIWTALGRTELETIDRLAVVAAAGVLIALVATLVRRLPRGAWWAILVVTIVPFLVAVASVLVERTGWTALSTGAMTALALVITVSRRPGLHAALRVAAAALVVPSIAVTAVCLGAELLVTSGSPVVLPIIAVLVAGVLAAAAWIEAGLHRLGIREAGPVTWAIEASAGLTGAIAVLLALVRVASGFDTAMIVLLVIGVGAAVARVLGGRRWGWWVAAAAWTGALWCALLLVEVDVLELYVLPPALAALTVGVIGLVRGRSGRAPAALAIAGLGAALLPTLLALIAVGSATGDLPGPEPSIPWRAVGLAAASVLLLAEGVALRAAPERIGVLRRALLVAAIVAAAGPAVQAARWGAEADPLWPGPTPMALALPTALLATALAGGSAAVLARELAPGPGAFDPRRWLGAPALAFVLLGPVLAIREDWGSIWALWGLMAAIFAVALLASAMTVRGTTLLPPVWLICLGGWVAAVGSWSQRELRVETFSLPMGLAVLTMGVVHLRWRASALARPEAGQRPARSLNVWPAGFSGSWWLLAPGLVLVFLPSVLSTGTDPVTWRAILVIALALVAILLGSILKLAAPFFVGLAVLPIENIVVFSVQIGKGVESLPWWITLATAGAVLLAIAMNAERKSKTGAKVSRIGEMR